MMYLAVLGRLMWCLFERLCQRFLQPALYLRYGAAEVLAARLMAEGCFQAGEATTEG